ncbi:MAG: alpha/beta hydrolase [Rubrivivax sp.]
MSILAFAAHAALAADRPWPLPADAKALAVNGYEITYVERGQPAGAAPTVLLLHGVGGDYRSMLPLAARLESRYHVVVPSLRHHFPEHWDGRGGDYAFAQHARDVAALIRQLGVGPVHLFGETYGATVAVLVARDAPQVLRSATSYAGMLAAREYMPPRSTDEGAKEAERTRLMAAALARGNEEEALRVHRDVIAGDGAWARSPEPYKQAMRDNVRTVAALFADELVSIPCDGLGAIRVPLLMLVGDKSHPASRKATENALACLPQARSGVVPGGVGSSQVATDEVAKAFVAFIESVGR